MVKFVNANLGGKGFHFLRYPILKKEHATLKFGQFGQIPLVVKISFFAAIGFGKNDLRLNFFEFFRRRASRVLDPLYYLPDINSEIFLELQKARFFFYEEVLRANYSKYCPYLRFLKGQLLTSFSGYFFSVKFFCFHKLFDNSFFLPTSGLKSSIFVKRGLQFRVDQFYFFGTLGSELLLDFFFIKDTFSVEGHYKQAISLSILTSRAFLKGFYNCNDYLVLFEGFWFLRRQFVGIMPRLMVSLPSLVVYFKFNYLMNRTLLISGYLGFLKIYLNSTQLKYFLLTPLLVRYFYQDINFLVRKFLIGFSSYFVFKDDKLFDFLILATLKQFNRFQFFILIFYSFYLKFNVLLGELKERFFLVIFNYLNVLIFIINCFFFKLKFYKTSGFPILLRTPESIHNFFILSMSVFFCFLKNFLLLDCIDSLGNVLNFRKFIFYFFVLRNQLVSFKIISINFLPVERIRQQFLISVDEYYCYLLNFFFVFFRF